MRSGKKPCPTGHAWLDTLCSLRRLTKTGCFDLESLDQPRRLSLLVGDTARQLLVGQALIDNARVLLAVELAPEHELVWDVDGLAREYGLTSREVQVSLLLAERMTEKEIASILAISHATVRRHTESVFKKLRVHNRRAVGGAIALYRERRKA